MERHRHRRRTPARRRRLPGAEELANWKFSELIRYAASVSNEEGYLAAVEINRRWWLLPEAYRRELEAAVTHLIGR
jgi:hypothetical protein